MLRGYKCISLLHVSRCSQSRLLIKSEKRLWSLAHIYYIYFFQSTCTQRRSTLCFLVLKTNFLGSSKRSVHVVCLLLVEIMSHILGCSKQSWLPPGFWRRAWFRPWLYRRTNEHVMRVSSFPVSGTAVALSPPAARHSTLAICRQVHISHCRELKWLNRQKKSFICSSLRIPRLWFGIKHLLHDLLQGQFLSSSKGYDFRHTELPLAGGNLPEDLI